MYLNRRQMLGTLAGTMVGASALARDVAIDPGLCGGPPVEGFDGYCFTDSAARRHQVYVADGGGPAVVLLHELPGLVDADLAVARRLARERFTVVVPLLFGQPGGNGHAIHYATALCGEAEFGCKRGEATSPHVRWLRELTADVRQCWPEGKGIGVIGMCLTGAFPLAMLREATVVAPVLCQPTIPFNIWTRLGWFTDKDALGVSDGDLQYAKHERDTPLLGIRYAGDWRCRRDRFDRLAKEFEGRFHRLELPGKHHSSLGSDFCDVAFDEVTSFLNQQLRTVPDAAAKPFPQRSWTGNAPAAVGPTCVASPHHQ